ncbi:hypothetical protein [Pseudoxanthomonas sp. 10H]|uniref:hypothetical protein n=1 Tax=Pseudoxanthomonas sp. 10H TaxID=3242729 RepID=UPI00355625F7
MTQGNRTWAALVALALLGVGGCAGGPGHAQLDSTDSFCASQYREHQAAPPPPPGLSREERDRYEERARDYHVSRQCQQAHAEAARHAIPAVPKPRAR